MALATSADVVARIGELTPEQAAKVDALLDDATAELQAYASAALEPVDGASIIVYGYERLRLPRWPVRAVTSVALIDEPNDDLAVTGWRWDGKELVWLDEVPKPTWTVGEPTWRIVYDYGFATAPDDLKARCVLMVSRVLNSPTAADGLVSENIGQYGFQVSQATGSQGAGVALTRGDEAFLKSAGYRRQSHTMRL